MVRNTGDTKLLILFLLFSPIDMAPCRRTFALSLTVVILQQLLSQCLTVPVATDALRNETTSVYALADW